MRNPLSPKRPKYKGYGIYDYTIRGGAWTHYSNRVSVFDRWKDHAGVVFDDGDGNYGFRLFRTQEKK